MKPLLCGLLALSGATGIRAQTWAPQDFAFAVPVTTTQAAAAYRFALPLAIYQSAYREDLGDVRVFNARGTAVPFSLSRPAVPAQVHPAAVALPMFPLRQGTRVVIDGIRVSIDSSQSAIKLQTQDDGAVVMSVGQYILDARALDVAICALRLGWPDAASDFSGRVRIEVSDDLGSWRTVAAAAPIANLHANGQTLIENRVALTASKGKYWRITWLGSPPAFELASVSAEPADSLSEPVRAMLEVSGIPDPQLTTDYWFDLGARPPVSRVNLLLPEVNTIVDVELSSRPSSRDPWRFVTRAGVYRLGALDAEQHNAALEIAVNADRYWRARISKGPIAPHLPLRLHVEWIPNELTFLAQGEGPFLLAYGNATAASAEADFSHIPASLDIAAAAVGAPRLLGGPNRLVAKPAPYPWMRVLLWSVLILAVILLAWMAYRLSQDP